MSAASAPSPPMIRPFDTRIFQVEAGTVIRHTPSGEEFNVTDSAAVFRGHDVFVTPKNYDAIKNHPDVRTP